MTWKEDLLACSGKGDRITIAKKRKGEGSSQMNYTGQTKYFIWINEKSIKAVDLNQGGPPSPPPRALVGAFNGQGLLCWMSYKRAGGVRDEENSDEAKAYSKCKSYLKS